MQPVCGSCGKEMVCIQNGTIVYHPYEHARPSEKAQEKIGGLTIVNTDVLIEGSWQEGDIDFAVEGDTYECSSCGMRVVIGFGRKIIDYQVPQDQLQRLVKEAIKRGYAIKLLRKT